tara:strand:- start:16 stop:240 length:225 start_codon:yes stop_codon:yes gene_type:complete
MKITKQRLKEIIKEELAQMGEVHEDPDTSLLRRLHQAYGRRATHVKLRDIKKLHPSYKGSVTDAAEGLGIYTGR